MKRILIGAFCSTLLSAGVQAQELAFQRQDVVLMPHVSDTSFHYVVLTDQIYNEGLDTLSQISFWRKIMRLSPDSGLINRQGTREIFCSVSSKEWNALGQEKQMSFRDSIRKVHSIPDSISIFFTQGKNDFYNAAGVISDIHKAIPIFVQEDVDPFYAQAILLIESPGKVRKSNAGAVGSFQLMRSVAIQMGLKVNKNVDERKNFEKSAWAAAKLIRTICIPQVNAMLEERGIAYSPDDLWYRLMVLHVYHAGAGNVRQVLDVINPQTGGMWVIRQMWVTKAGSFGNASQNYSQLAVSAMLELDNALGRECTRTDQILLETK